MGDGCDREQPQGVGGMWCLKSRPRCQPAGQGMCLQGANSTDLQAIRTQPQPI